MSAIFTPIRYKLSIEDYHKLGDVGILNEDSRVELIEGELIQMAPIGVPHMKGVNRLTRLLVSAVGELAVVSVQNPIELPPHSEPQPDLALLKPYMDKEDRAAIPNDVLLVVEVADSTLAHDRGPKLRLYAKAGILEVWIADIEGQSIEVYRQPSASSYARKVIHRMGESVSPEALPQVRIQVSDVFA